MPRATLSVIALSLVCASRIAGAVSITFDNNLTITDNQIGFDLNPAIGIIDFDSTASGTLTASGYDVKGTVTINGSGGSLVNLPNATVLSLTNFVADVNGNTPGQQVIIDFSHTYMIGALNGNFADGLTAEVANGNNEPVFNNGTNSLAVMPGTDIIDAWYGYVSGAVITPALGNPPPILNPFQPAGGGSTAYPFYGHGPTFFSTFNPVVGGHLEFMLGSADSQLILPTSAEVGFSAVPLPAAAWLLGSGLIGLAGIAQRRTSTA